MIPNPARVPLNWPNQAFSQSQLIGNLDWHYQIHRHPDPKATSVLLIHGTGASSHSWGPIFTELSNSYTVLAPDLPGHGFTLGALKHQLHIDQIAVELKKLLEILDLWIPHTLVGHSAGANCVLTLANLSRTQPMAIIGFNPSFVSPPAAYSNFLAPLIHPIATSGLLANFLSHTIGKTKMVDQLLDSTRSQLNEEQRQHYRLLFKQSAHIFGAMNFMAATDIPQLLRNSSALTSQMTYLIPEDDPWVSKRSLGPIMQQYFPKAHLIHENGGHLFHEIHPDRATTLIDTVIKANQQISSP